MKVGEETVFQQTAQLVVLVAECFPVLELPVHSALANFFFCFGVLTTDTFFPFWFSQCGSFCALPFDGRRGVWDVSL